MRKVWEPELWKVGLVNDRLRSIPQTQWPTVAAMLRAVWDTTESEIECCDMLLHVLDVLEGRGIIYWFGCGDLPATWLAAARRPATHSGGTGHSSRPGGRSCWSWRTPRPLCPWTITARAGGGLLTDSVLKEERVMRSVTTMAICLSDDLAAWIRDQAEREGLGISAYVRQILMRERRKSEPEEVAEDETE